MRVEVQQLQFTRDWEQVAVDLHVIDLPKDYQSRLLHQHPFTRHAPAYAAHQRGRFGLSPVRRPDPALAPAGGSV